MEAIKKKMLAMKLDKENAIDLADQLEEQMKEKEMEMSKKEEEMADVVKRYQSLEAEKEAAESQLTETNQKLEDTEKRAQEHRRYSSTSVSSRPRRGVHRTYNSPRLAQVSIPPQINPQSQHCYQYYHHQRDSHRWHNNQKSNDSLPLRMSSSFIDFSSSSSSSVYQSSTPQQLRRQRRSRNRRGFKNKQRPVNYGCECTCQHCGKPTTPTDVMFISMYDFNTLGSRPEPEGCAANPIHQEEHVRPTKKSYVPYSVDEPLFSDYGDKSDSDDDYVIARKKQSIKDQKTAFAEAYCASKLNSGTLIQLAIIEAELKNLVHSSLDKVK
ncbi:unnamed protein product [Rodentolepis nana]|uniref:Tropomyosin n=1 Tax=Rodentolepis nana TaxID=102285 RepID=A0A0R3TJB9_RODNA|nr:unnamed protein product [Rodentolepis nana]